MPRLCHLIIVYKSAAYTIIRGVAVAFKETSQLLSIKKGSNKAFQ
jgi:hypothetical protein